MCKELSFVTYLEREEFAFSLAMATPYTVVIKVCFSVSVFFFWIFIIDLNKMCLYLQFSDVVFWG